jgi:hypothetical protein
MIGPLTSLLVIFSCATAVGAGLSIGIICGVGLFVVVKNKLEDYNAPDPVTTDDSSGQ